MAPMRHRPTSDALTSEPLGVGAAAPDLTLRDQHGAALGLADLRGGPALVVFYPYAFSGVCTSELRDLARSAELATALDRTGAVLVGVSCDPVFTQRAFADAEGLDFPLLSDFWPHGALAAAFGVLDAKRGCPRRSSFLLDADGVVRWALHHGMGEPRTVTQHLAALDAVG